MNTKEKEGFINRDKYLLEEIKHSHNIYLKEINKLKDKIYELEDKLDENKKDYDEEIYVLSKRYHKIREKNKKMVDDISNWRKAALRYNWLWKKVKEIGIKQAEDIFDCFDDVEIPETTIHERDQAIPTEQTDNIDYSDDIVIIDNQGNTDIITDIPTINDFMELFENNINALFIDCASQWDASIIIQSHYRGYRHRQIYNTIKDIKNNLENLE